VEVVLASEGAREDAINRATGAPRAVALPPLAALRRRLARRARRAAAGEAEAIQRRADATAKGLAVVASAMADRGGADAAALRVAEQYVGAFGQVAKAGTTVLLPAAVGDPAGMIAQALAIYRSVGAPGSSHSPRRAACLPPRLPQGQAVRCPFAAHSNRPVYAVLLQHLSAVSCSSAEHARCTAGAARSLAATSPPRKAAQRQRPAGLWAQSAAQCRRLHRPPKARRQAQGRAEGASAAWARTDQKIGRSSACRGAEGHATCAAAHMLAHAALVRVRSRCLLQPWHINCWHTRPASAL
jgi:hypothetical protein